MQIRTSVCAFAALIAFAVPVSVNAGTPRLSPEQAEHIQIITDACDAEVRSAIATARHQADALGQAPHFFLVEAGTGAVREVSEEEFLANAIPGCEALRAATDPVLAPLLVDPPTSVSAVRT